MKYVEEVEFERDLARHIFNVMDPSKPPHEVLKRDRSTFCTGCDNFSLDEKL